MAFTYDELLEKSKELYQPPQELTNFFTQEEIQQFNELYDSLPSCNLFTHARATRKDFLRVKEADAFNQLMLEKVQGLFPDQTITFDGGNFTEWHYPTPIHTDAHQYHVEQNDITRFVNNQQVLGYSLLIPMCTDTGKGTPSTIYFNQTSYGRSINPARVDTLSDNPELVASINGYTDQPYTDDRTGLEHVADSRLHGFTKMKTLDWNYGSAILWHRSQFHSGGNFSKEYNSKRHAILLFDFLNNE